MLYRPDPPRPPRGSTEWGARQFYRLLDEEERVAAERNRLLAEGWRLPRAENGPYSGVSRVDDEHNLYAGAVQLRLDDRRALDDEARRRVTALSIQAVPTGPTPDAGGSWVAGSPIANWVGGGRFGTRAPRKAGAPVPGRELASYAGTGEFDQLIGRSGGGRAALVSAYVALATTLIALMTQMPLTREEAETLRRKREAAQFAYQRLSHQMAAAFSSQDLEEIKAATGLRFDILEPERAAPPRDFDPEEARRIQQEFGSPPPSILPSIDLIPETYPIAEDDLPRLEFFPDLSGEIEQVTILDYNPWGSRGSPWTQNHIWDVQKDFEERHRDAIKEGYLEHIGGGFMPGGGGEEKRETAIPGPGIAFEGDTRPGSRFPDLLYLNRITRRLIAINTVDVDVNGNITRRELDAAAAMRRAGADVYLIRKPHQME